MRKRIAALLAVAGFATAGTAYAYEDTGGGGGSEQIKCYYQHDATPYIDMGEYHQFYTRTGTWGGHCNP